MPFTDASFINDCLLHVNHPLLQLADIMDRPTLLSTAALFYIFYSPRILTEAIKAASYPARWILRSHMQYAIKMSAILVFKFHKVV